MQITIIVDPFQPDPMFPNSVSSRAFYRVDAFAAGLAQAAGVPVPVIEGTLADAPPEGFLLLFDLRGFAEHPGTGPRSVLMTQFHNLELEEHSLAGAVDTYHDYEIWSAQRERNYLYGRRDVAAAMGVEIEPAFPCPRYSILCREHPGNLVDFLAAYLAAYEELLGPL